MMPDEGFEISPKPEENDMDITFKTDSLKDFKESDARHVKELMEGATGFLLFVERDNGTGGLYASKISAAAAASFIHEILSDRPEIRLMLMMGGDIPAPTSIDEIAKMADALKNRFEGDDPQTHVCERCEDKDCENRMKPYDPLSKLGDKVDPSTAEKWK